jgi:hypothetical protein
MLIAALALIGCLPVFAVQEMAALRTVRAVDPAHATALRLSAGTYAIDQDPDATNFPLPGSSLRVTGPHGPVRTWETPWNISPSDLGGAFLGVGTFAQAARFTAGQPGVYRVAVTGPGAGARLYVTEPYGTAALGEGPWALAIIAAIITLAVTGSRMFRRERRLRGAVRVRPLAAAELAGREQPVRSGVSWD